MKRVIGITGGVGSGKSLVLQLLHDEWQAKIIQADRVAAELEEPGRQGLAALTAEFGTGILAPDGRLDRAAFAARIFADPEALKTVNRLIHPLVYGELARQISESRQELVAAEAALFSAEKKNIFTELWFVDVQEENRIRRLMENRGYTRERCIAMMENQPSREDFLAMADRVIDNNGSKEAVRAQLCTLLGGPER